MLLFQILTEDRVILFQEPLHLFNLGEVADDALEAAQSLLFLELLLG